MAAYMFVMSPRPDRQCNVAQKVPPVTIAFRSSVTLNGNLDLFAICSGRKNPARTLRTECGDPSFIIPEFQEVNCRQLRYARPSRCVIVARDFHSDEDRSVLVKRVGQVLMFHWREPMRSD
jgi:hypothetical protein